MPEPNSKMWLRGTSYEPSAGDRTGPFAKASAPSAVLREPIVSVTLVDGHSPFAVSAAVSASSSASSPDFSSSPSAYTRSCLSSAANELYESSAVRFIGRPPSSTRTRSS